MNISWRLVWLLTFCTKCHYTQWPCWLLSNLHGSREGVFYLKSYFEGYVRISWRHYTSWNVTLILNLGPAWRRLHCQIINVYSPRWKVNTLSKSNDVLSNLKGICRRILISRWCPSLELHCHVWEIQNEKDCCHSRQKENKLINEKFAWNEKHYFVRQYTNHIIITRCLTANGCCVWFLLSRTVAIPLPQ